jgi:hypothetical protein
MPNLNIVVKTVAASATPEFLANHLVRFHSAYFIAQKAAGTANTGNVTIQLQDVAGTWTDFKVLAPDDEWGYSLDWSHKNDPFNGNQIKIKVATNGDGVCVAIT